MTEQRFAFLHLEGGRFDQYPGQMPVECLNEIAIYRRCIVSLASDAWRMDHPERERLPRNFSKEFQLLLSGIGTGSSLPFVDRAVPDFGFDGYFEAARDKFTTLLERLRKGEGPPAGLTRETLRLAKGFGRSFRARETVTLGHPNDPTKRVALDAMARERLHDMDLAEATSEREVALLGKIAEWNIEGRSFDLRHEGHLVKHATIPDGTDIAALLVNGESAPVVVTGKATLDADGVAKEFQSHVRLADATPFLSYLDGRLAVDSGIDVNEAVVGIVRRWTPFWLRVAPRFGVALVDGLVRVEWERDGWDCSLDIAGDGTIFAHRYHAEDGLDVESMISSFDGDDATALVENWTAGTW